MYETSWTNLYRSGLLSTDYSQWLLLMAHIEKIVIDSTASTPSFVMVPDRMEQDGSTIHGRRTAASGLSFHQSVPNAMYHQDNTPPSKCILLITPHFTNAMPLSEKTEANRNTKTKTAYHPICPARRKTLHRFTPTLISRDTGSTHPSTNPHPNVLSNS
ncbi:hypothetical protein CDAR_10191 [Caerostris darwini]|uniref:Uncharacterized protein n=1 Tax=Caerostris darwini TaxID=1538125 RepID=A0AAV4RE27_9ARAC|nr:hypothetical protein CDAR_10191 [Caerostris darwini]